MMIVKIIQDGNIGRVQMLRATFSYRTHFDPDSRLFTKELGEGAILDVGCCMTSMSLLLAGAADGKSMIEPVDVKGGGSVHDPYLPPVL